ncbi:MAG: class I SAM-dependent methyltransferase [Alphaproteobacteria bacterium]
MGRTIAWSEALSAYLAKVGVREHAVLARCRQETATMGGIARMQIGPEQGAFMGFLAKAIGAERVLEIGVFTGYSSLAVTLAMGPAGRLTACDLNEEFVAKARTYWRAANVESQIELRLGPAKETMVALIGEGRSNLYDMAFIDADKVSYDAYYEGALKLVRPGGLILIDNTLWSGAVADPKVDDPDTLALRALNARLHGDERIDYCLTPMGDGLTLCRRRG